MTVDPTRAYAVALLNRADVVPDANTLALLALIVPLVEADAVALLDQDAKAADGWQGMAAGFIRGSMERIGAGEHRGMASTAGAKAVAHA